MDKIKTLVQYIIGTCDTFDEGCEVCGLNPDDLTLKELEEFDSYTFCCDICGWWYPIEEKVETEYGEALCEECAEMANN